MTPAVGWTEQHYYRARLECERAWEATAPQLTLTGWADMMDGLDASRTGTAASVEPVVNPPDTPPRRVRPHNNDDGGRYRTDRARGHRQEGQ